MSNVDPARDTELRDTAIKRLKKRRDFHGHLLVYVLVNAFLVVIWAVTSPDGFFWPIFPIVGWGIGVVMNAWDVYFAQDIGEREIQREIDHMLHRR
ncbi:2TM domain-containing protein [Nocardioides sp. WL0053]|uniref:2TM domain-containing protein n=1 Tax=Nocardioides jiangsuensis TaxID=2866161 RepID=A0ABS7RLM9_9ACTN|nr:2TM domain-containing protein [Nocardioides jiangsuensis]MBY9074452.1 2TM domain-containing protein [Nocardioides jiangsuensis]